MSRKTVVKSLAACDSRRLCMRRITYDSAAVDISVFIEQRNISLQNEISLKTMRLGVLSWEQLKHRETRGSGIVSLEQLRLGVEEQLLIFSSCLSPGSSCWIPRHSVPPLFSLVGVLWRTKHNTIDAILIQWHANKWLREIHKLKNLAHHLGFQAWSFVGKLEQVSTYILWKFKTINVRK